jgi:hypothetical protein
VIEMAAEMGPLRMLKTAAKSLQSDLAETRRFAADRVSLSDCRMSCV